MPCSVGAFISPQLLRTAINAVTATASFGHSVCGCGAAAAGAAAASAASKVATPRVFFRGSAGGGRVALRGGTSSPGHPATRRRRRLALASAASARDCCWLGDAGAASRAAGGRASSARAGSGWVQILVSNLESQGTVLLTILSPVHHCLPSHRRTQGWRASSRQVSRPWSVPRPTTLL